jgi:hypothetical protein
MHVSVTTAKKKKSAVARGVSYLISGRRKPSLGRQNTTGYRRIGNKEYRIRNSAEETGTADSYRVVEDQSDNKREENI